MALIASITIHLHCKFCRNVALWSVYAALLSVKRALLSVNRALLIQCTIHIHCIDCVNYDSHALQFL